MGRYVSSPPYFYSYGGNRPPAPPREDRGVKNEDIYRVAVHFPPRPPRLSSTTPYFFHVRARPSLSLPRREKTAIKYKTLHFALPSPSLPAKNRKCNKTESEKRPLLYQRPRPVVTLLSFPLPPSARNKLATFLKRGRSATSEIYAWKKAAVLRTTALSPYIFSFFFLSRSIIFWCEEGGGALPP